MRRLRIRESPLFADANIDAIAELARAGSEIRYPSGTYLWRIGDPSSFSLTIDYGQVKCTNNAGQIITVGAGYGLGVLDAFGAQPRSYDALTETKIIAQRSGVETFFAVIEGHFDLAMELIAILSRTQLRR